MKKTPDRYFAGIIARVCALAIIISSCNNTLRDDGFISVSNRSFIDPQGRVIIFHGVNLVNKNPDVSFEGFMPQEKFNKMAATGYNLVRLGFTWSGIEPEPGLYNEKYLEGIDGAVGRAENAGLYVLLDMHQDLFSQLYSDGAPEWATLNEDKEHLRGEVWSDSYLISPAVQTAFDNFWANAPAPDGIGIQDHLASVWKMLAERYADDKQIIGYDILNEPFMGSSANMVMPTFIGTYAHLIGSQGADVPPMEELGEMWGRVESRLEILKTLQDTTLYQPVILSAKDLVDQFEQGPLSDFYQKVRNRIREVNDHHIIFLEHNYFSNMGVPASFKIPVDDDGINDRLIAYAPHGYDLVVDTDGVDDPANTRVEFIFNQAYNTSIRLGIPMLVGEWGAFGGDRPGYLDAGKFIVSRFEKHQCSDTYWHYERDAESTSFFRMQNRFYPGRINGKLESYSYDVDEGSFVAKWTEDPYNKAESRFYVPYLIDIPRDKVIVEPMSDVRYRMSDEGNGGWLEVEPVGGERIIKY